MIQPFRNPQIAPAAIPPNDAGRGPTPDSSKAAMTTVLSAIIEPTDRSIPPRDNYQGHPKSGDSYNSGLAGRWFPRLRALTKLSGPINEKSIKINASPARGAS